MNRDPDEFWDPESWGPPPYDETNREEWDEEDWEAFLARQDVLRAKYDELFETFADHPDREKLIADEMHWPLPQDLWADLPEPTDDDEDFLDDEDLEQADEEADELERIPAYRLAQDYTAALEQTLEAALPTPEEDEDADRALLAAGEVVSQLIGGHGLGYERDTLCGNIVCCRRALASLGECFDGLLALRKRGALSPRRADALLVRGQHVGNAIAERIAELRAKIWWR